MLTRALKAATLAGAPAHMVINMARNASSPRRQPEGLWCDRGRDGLSPVIWRILVMTAQRRVSAGEPRSLLAIAVR
jgi:hypothetical protein